MSTTGARERVVGPPLLLRVPWRWLRGHAGAASTFFVLWLVAWQLIVPLLPTRLLPLPLDVAEFMWDEVRGETLVPHTIYVAFGTTLYRLVVGFGIAVAIGTPIGLLMGVSRRVEAFSATSWS